MTGPGSTSVSTSSTPSQALTRPSECFDHHLFFLFDPPVHLLHTLNYTVHLEAEVVHQNDGDLLEAQAHELGEKLLAGVNTGDSFGGQKMIDEIGDGVEREELGVDERVVAVEEDVFQRL